MSFRFKTLLGFVLGIALIAGCAGNAGSTDEPTATPVATSSPPADTAAGDPSIVEGVFDVGGHRLHLRCAGVGAPTVVYLHGAIDRPGPQPVETARRIEEEISGTNRFCAYDRRNVGKSDSVDAEQTPDDMIEDLRSVLGAAGEEPPYVILGASFGGLFGYVYANTHPEEVVGMVLLDSMFPDEFSLEYLFPAEERYEAFDVEDREESLERISHFRLISAAYEFVGQEPDIPVIYLASEQEPWDQQGLGAEYDAQIIGLLEAYVGRFSPGELVWVDSPHFMEPVIPDVIADALRVVIERAAGK